MKDYIEVCRRDGNKKRNFVLVNKAQAKHFPCSPSDLLNMANKLSYESRVIGKSILMIAFAETATALGCCTADMLSRANKVKIVTTTRLPLDQDYLSFEEEHSHATSQKLSLTKLKESIDWADMIVFLDDEISTGKTILNVINAMQGLLGSKPIVVWSIINSMTEEECQNFQERKIGLHFLKSYDRSSLIKQAKELPEEHQVSKMLKGTGVPISVHQLHFDYKVFREPVDAEIFMDELIEILSPVIMRVEDADIIGTEECMLPAVVFGLLMRENNPDAEIVCHSTTRSPIIANDDNCLKDRISLPSVYGEYRTFLYGVKNGPKNLIVVSDSYNAISLAKTISQYRKLNSVTVIELVR